jgi:DNA-3-methyladenine glycosylase
VEHHIPGTAYVYLNYGVHWMLNVLVKGGSQDGIILIRALEPIRGIPIMQQRRGQTNLHSLCSGPGKLTQALGITGTDHGVDLCGGRVGFKARRDRVEVITDVRIGINRSVHLPWRFVRKDCRFVSVRPKGVEEMPAKSEQKKKRVQ